MRPTTNTIGRWTVGEKIGGGGMGMVYACHDDARPPRRGALKVLRGEVPSSERERFIREGRILHSLSHPGVVSLLDVVTDCDPPCLVMEYVAGRPLDRVLAEQTVLPATDVLDLGEQLADALRYVHSCGITHRDVKPANIILSQESSTDKGLAVKLVDFGIALDSGRSRLTQAGINLGTGLYTPPEWATMADLDTVRWDMFSVGAVLFEALVGQLPYAQRRTEGGPNAMARMLRAKDRCLPLDLGVEWAPTLRRLLQRMTCPNPADRVGSAEEVLHLIRQARLELTGRGEPLYWLRCVNGDRPGMRYPIRFGITRVGRGSNSGDEDVIEMDLADQEEHQLRRWVSRAHAEIWLGGQGLCIADTESMNGTFVNGCALQARTNYRLAEGDLISFGRLRFIVEPVSAQSNNA